MRPHLHVFTKALPVTLGTLVALSLSAAQASIVQAKRVRDLSPPTASWKTPAAGATISGTLFDATKSGLSGPCEIYASDDVGVSKVVFYIDGRLLNTEVMSPYNCNVDTTSVADGSHTLKAIAYDASGKSTTTLRDVTVKNAPSVAWKTPAAGANVSGMLWDSARSGPSGPCEASATDNEVVSKVVFYVDSTQLNTETAAPYNCKFDTTTVADGSHTLKAVAYDSGGRTATSLRTVTVSNVPPPPPGDTTPPSVSWTTPAAGATVSGLLWDAAGSGPSGRCEASASDNVGVSKVVFHVDGTQLNTERAVPYNCKLDTTTLTDGNHTLKAVAYDAAGNTSSAERVVSVNNASAPPPPTVDNRTLVFEENFDGSVIDTNRWGMYNSPGHGGNGLRRPSAMSVANGLLAVTASWDGTNIVSGGMYHKVNYTYGSFEFRVRTEPDPSGQTSGVVLTWPQSERWPVDGENDIYETGTSPNRTAFNTFIHYGVDNRQYQFAHAADATQWHTVRMDWTASAIKIYRDGALVWTLSDTAAIPDVAHHLSIQLDAFANRAMQAPVRMYVDWVRVYQ